MSALALPGLVIGIVLGVAIGLPVGALIAWNAVRRLGRR